MAARPELSPDYIIQLMENAKKNKEKISIFRNFFNQNTNYGEIILVVNHFRQTEPESRLSTDLSNIFMDKSVGSGSLENVELALSLQPTNINSYKMAILNNNIPIVNRLLEYSINHGLRQNFNNWLTIAIREKKIGVASFLIGVFRNLRGEHDEPLVNFSLHAIHLFEEGYSQLAKDIMINNSAIFDYVKLFQTLFRRGDYINLRWLAEYIKLEYRVRHFQHELINADYTVFLRRGLVEYRDRGGKVDIDFLKCFAILFDNSIIKREMTSHIIKEIFHDDEYVFLLILNLPSFPIPGTPLF